MTPTTRVLVLVLALAGPVSAAQAAFESLSASAAVDFQAAVSVSRASFFRPQGPAGAPRSVQAAAMLDSWDEYLRDHTGVVGEQAVEGAAPVLAGELDLKGLLNRQLKTALVFNMGGRTVWCGGIFDRNQTAYLSVLIDGEPVRYYDIKDIYKREKTLRIGSQTYRLWLSANIFNKVKSEIVFTNQDNEYDETRFTLKKMLSSIADAGALVTLTGQPYRVFYTDGLSARLFTFLMTEPKGDLHVYLVPVEAVPSDRIAIFKLFGDRSVGLTRNGESLQVYGIP